eukprot:g4954.t1
MDRYIVLCTCLAAIVSAGTCRVDDVPYNYLLWPGTHNSAINLGADTLLRPKDAEDGSWPSKAQSSYQYPIMDQRLSVKDQLVQGIRVVDLEIGMVGGEGTGKGWACDDEGEEINGDACVERWTLEGRCFSDCPFLITHGTIDEAVGEDLGYTFPESIFQDVADFVAERSDAIVTLLIFATHGNSMPDLSDVERRLNSTGLLDFVWNFDRTKPFNRYPTVGEMRASGRTVMLGAGWPGPQIASSHIAVPNVVSGPTEICMDGEPCLEGWDAVTFDQLTPDKAAVSNNPPMGANSTRIFTIENLSSRRGRDENSTSYWPLPNALDDAPYLAGGNPSQAMRAAEYDHVVALVDRWSDLLESYGSQPGWILVDFFNTTTPDGTSSRTLLSNDREGLIRAVEDINSRRISEFCNGGEPSSATAQ